MTSSYLLYATGVTGIYEMEKTFLVSPTSSGTNVLVLFNRIFELRLHLKNLWRTIFRLCK